MLLFCAVVVVKGQLYVAAIYDRINLGDCRVHLGLTASEFAAELRRQLDTGRILAFTQAYERRGRVHFSAVWSPRSTRYWAAGNQMSKYALLNRLDDYSAANVPLACVSAYVDDDEDVGGGGSLMFAALWR